MSDNGSDSRYRLIPLDKGGLVYFGVNMTNGKQSAIFFAKDATKHDHQKADPHDFVFWLVIEKLCTITGHGDERMDDDWDAPPEAEIEGYEYWVKAWNRSFDLAFVSVIDRLIDARMKNASRVSITMQLEMPI
jgi:hypothetical protein